MVASHIQQNYIWSDYFVWSASFLIYITQSVLLYLLYGIVLTYSINKNIHCDMVGCHMETTSIFVRWILWTTRTTTRTTTTTTTTISTSIKWRARYFSLTKMSLKKRTKRGAINHHGAHCHMWLFGRPMGCSYSISIVSACVILIQQENN